MGVTCKRKSSSEMSTSTTSLTTPSSHLKTTSHTRTAKLPTSVSTVRLTLTPMISYRWNRTMFLMKWTTDWTSKLFKLSLQASSPNWLVVESAQVISVEWKVQELPTLHTPVIRVCNRPVASTPTWALKSNLMENYIEEMSKRSTKPKDTSQASFKCKTCNKMSRGLLK